MRFVSNKIIRWLKKKKFYDLVLNQLWVSSVRIWICSQTWGEQSFRSVFSMHRKVKSSLLRDSASANWAKRNAARNDGTKSFILQFTSVKNIQGWSRQSMSWNWIDKWLDRWILLGTKFMVGHGPVPAITIFRHFDQFNACFTETRITLKQPSSEKTEKELSHEKTNHDTLIRAYNSTIERHTN